MKKRAYNTIKWQLLCGRVRKPVLTASETATMKEAAQAKSMNSMEEVTMFLGFYSKRKKVIHKLHTLSVVTCNKYIANSEPSSQAQNNYPI
jgi:hypothetical protein